MAVALNSLKEEMVSMIATITNVKEESKQVKFRIFSEQLPRIVEYYKFSRILHPEAILIKFAEKMHNIFNAAVSYVPEEVENGVIERNVFHLKALQDRIPGITSESKDFLSQNGKKLRDAVLFMEYLCDTLCAKMFYIYDSDVHPFRTHHQIVHNAVPYIRTFLNARFVFFAYSALGSFSRVPHVYLNLTQYMELAETLFLKNCRLRVYTARPHLFCQICDKPIDVNVQDFALIGLCGHLYCLSCSDWEPSFRYRLPCITCETFTDFWIRNSFVFTTWKVSRNTEKVFIALDIPEDWYQVVPEAFYDINYEREPGEDGDPASFGTKGFFGSPGCNKLVPIVYREEDYVGIESRAAFAERISDNKEKEKNNPIFSQEWIMGPAPLNLAEAPPPP